MRSETNRSTYGIEKGKKCMFSRFFYSRSLKCPLHIASYTLRIGVSVMELLGSEVLISYAFQMMRYISIVSTGYFVRSLFTDTIQYIFVMVWFELFYYL